MRNGIKRGIQNYKCHTCGMQFVGGKRLNNEELWQHNVKGKQTYAQFAELFGCSKRTIQRRLDQVKVESSIIEAKDIDVLMDTTYFGRTFGVMLFKDAYGGKNLFKQYVRNETSQLYADGITHLKSKGFTIKAIVCEDRRGLLQLFGDMPIQMCQFHQKAIVTRYLTRKPKIQAGKELYELSNKLAHTDKESFIGGLLEWHTKWQDFLNERTKVELTGRTHYTNKGLRSAYRSMHTNLPWLFYLV